MLATLAVVLRSALTLQRFFTCLLGYRIGAVLETRWQFTKLFKQWRFFVFFKHDAKTWRQSCCNVVVNCFSLCCFSLLHVRSDCWEIFFPSNPWIILVGTCFCIWQRYTLIWKGYHIASLDSSSMVMKVRLSETTCLRLLL